MTQRSARNTAMDLLSRREHSRRQLFDKLKQRGFEHEDIESALDLLQAENLLNDERFAEHPGVLETPKGEDLKEDIMNLATLNSLKEK